VAYMTKGRAAHRITVERKGENETIPESVERR